MQRLRQRERGLGEDWVIVDWEEDEDLDDVLGTLNILIRYLELIDGKCRCGQPRMWPSGGKCERPQFTLMNVNDVTTFPKIIPFKIYHYSLGTIRNKYPVKPFIYKPIKGCCAICRLPIKKLCYICESRYIYYNTPEKLASLWFCRDVQKKNAFGERIAPLCGVFW